MQAHQTKLVYVPVQRCARTPCGSPPVGWFSAAGWRRPRPPACRGRSWESWWRTPASDRTHAWPGAPRLGSPPSWEPLSCSGWRVARRRRRRLLGGALRWSSLVLRTREVCPASCWRFLQTQSWVAGRAETRRRLAWRNCHVEMRRWRVRRILEAGHQHLSVYAANEPMKGRGVGVRGGRCEGREVWGEGGVRGGRCEGREVWGEGGVGGDKCEGRENRILKICDTKMLTPLMLKSLHT